ncbi:MAG: TetR/AcrR family transcriptional regulator [Pseudomonadota bacterium]
MPDGSPQVRKGRKFDQVVEGATEVFMEVGFDRASVDDIARRAGVSKATLYSYFPDKRLLFVEVMSRECEARAQQAEALIDKSRSPRTVMPLAARVLMDFYMSDFGQQSFRLAIGQSGQFEELGQGFYDSGPGLIERELVPYFDEAEARGELDIPDKVLAAHQFAELCKSWIFPRVMMCVQTEFTEEEKQRTMDGAVDMFLARYAA